MTIKLPTLDYRPYQAPLIRYMRGGIKHGMTASERNECRKRKSAVWVAHRRSGKDVTCWQYMVEAALEDKGTYFYCLPEFTHARRVIWEGMLNDGVRFLDLIPAALVKSKNESQMKIELVNGSIIQLVGSDQYDRLVGTNPKGIVFSEYSLTHPMAWLILRAILAANGGWVIFNGTPRGKNHFWEMLQKAKQDPAWFWAVDTAGTTGVLSVEILNKERGEMDLDVFNQEYFCSFDAATKGAYYSDQIVALREQKRMCKVPYEPALPVYTVSDPGDVVFAMVFFQVYGKEVRIIDADEMYSPSPSTIYETIRSKPFKRYGKHFFPNDATVKKMGAAQKSLVMQMQEAGLTDIETLPPQTSKMDGIKQVQTVFSSFWIDEKLETKVLEPLANYAPNYNERSNSYSSEPAHNWASHMSDAIRYLVLSLTKITNSLKPVQRKERRPIYVGVSA